MVKSNQMSKTPEQIFDEEFVPHMDSLYNFAYHLTYDEDEAKDLVQETCLKAFRFINNYHADTNAKAWLFRILKNTFINTYRQNSKQPNKVDYEDIVIHHDSDDAGHPSYLDLREEIFQGMIGDEVASAINALPVDFRTVILLCDIEGFSYEEIAKIVDIPIGTVRSRLHRARNILKVALKSYAEQYGYSDKKTKQS
jgi:RNA polymerase sigma factor (sigma-70 family)